MDNILVFGYQSEASGKTTISAAIARALHNSGVDTGVLKPVSAHNFWYQYDHTLRNYEMRELFSEDAYGLSLAAGIREPMGILNPVDRLISQPKIEKSMDASPISRVVAERLTLCDDGVRNVYLVNPEAHEKLLVQRDIIEKILDGKEVRVCRSADEWGRAEAALFAKAVESCYAYLRKKNDVNVVESFNDELPFLLPQITHVLMVSPGRIHFYDPDDFERCFRLNAGLRGRLRGRDFYKQIQSTHIMELAPLKKSELGDYDFLAENIGIPVLETLEIM